MQILFLKTGGKLESWAERFANSDASMEVVVADRRGDLESYRRNSFALAVCSWDSECPWDDDSVASVRAMCDRVVCLVDPSDSAAHQAAYAAGFDDCIPIDCCEQEWAAKLEQAKRTFQLRERLDQALKLESIGELAAGIAHEINTPIQYVGDNTRFVQTACDDLIFVLKACQSLITAIDTKEGVGEAALKLQSTLEAADADYLVDEMPSAISQTLEGLDRVASIVRAMKEFSHPGASEMTLTDLTKSIDATVMIARNEWKYVADVETDYDPALGSVPCLPGELNQVVLNLIVNAAHAIKDALDQDDQQHKGKITISTKLAEPNAEIRVSDTGTGISPENVEKIFNPFFTTKAAGSGTGQGLAIAHSVIVEKHDGVISVESELGAGSTFVIQIPLQQDHAGESSAAMATV